jgi:hypothetical protein
MFRKLIVILCLVSFTPAAVTAQVLSAVAAPPVSTGSATERSAQPSRDLNLSLPAETSTALLLAAAETQQGTAMAAAPEQKCVSRSSHSWDNFLEVHFGGYRWVWWAGAVAILVAIHAGAD